MWHHFWFSDSWDLLRLLDGGHDSGFLGVTGSFLFCWNMSVKSPPSSLEPESASELLADPAADPRFEPGFES